MRRDVERWLRTRGWAEAEDLASDAIVLALARFGAALPNSGAVYAWCRAVARNLGVDGLRRSRLAHVSFGMAVDELPDAARESAWTRDRIVAWAADWRSTLSPADNETLALLLAGVDGNAEIARLRGRSLRAVQASRARIAAAARAWNLSRALHGQTISSCRLDSSE